MRVFSYCAVAAVFAVALAWNRIKSYEMGWFGRTVRCLLVAAAGAAAVWAAWVTLGDR